jgi:hypothetical protein
MKLPLLNPYNAQSKRESDRAAAVRFELYKLQTEDGVAVEPDGKLPKETGQFDRYCMPVLGTFGRSPLRKGMILLAL